MIVCCRELGSGMLLFVKRLVAQPLFMLFLMLPLADVCRAESVNLGSWNETTLSQLISSAQQADNSGDAIVILSTPFKNTPYAARTLLGGPNDPEELVINLAGFDCFTFLDIVEALRRSPDIEAFPDQLKEVRYFDGKVTYENRRHFFSDWVDDASVIEDVTEKLGKGTSLTVDKRLNLKAGGALWLPGVGVTSRQVHYIPTASIDENLLSALKSGDYVGIYSDLPGLDVSHTGIVVVDRGRVVLRHASSRSQTGRVVDEDLLQYMQDKPGLIVYRVKP